jgi:hypothetical protein
MEKSRSGDIIIQIRDKNPGSAALLPINAEKMTVC